MDFREAFATPIIEDVSGQKIEFPVLTIEDHSVWVAGLHAERKIKSKALIPAGASEMEKFRMMRMVEFDEPTLDTIAALVWTPKGARLVLEKSLAKAGRQKAEIDQIIKAIPPRQLVVLAVEVSALFERAPEPSNGQGDKKEGDDPNARSAAAMENQPAADPAATGSST